MSNNLSKIQKKEVSTKEDPIFNEGSSKTDHYLSPPTPIPEVIIWIIGKNNNALFAKNGAQDSNNNIINQINNFTIEKLNVDSLEISNNDSNMSTESNSSNLLGNIENPTELSLVSFL